MPPPSDPAPCDRDERPSECRQCGKRLCSAASLTVCPDCDGVLQNLSRPRPE